MNQPRTVKPGIDIAPWPEQKLVRGISHLGAISEVASAWDAGAHVWADLTLSQDHHFIDAVLRTNATPPIEEMALRLGDALHNFRSALDALTWALCHLDNKKPSNPRSIYFPCVTDERKWTATARTLSSMPSEFLDRIRQVQPFAMGGAGNALRLLVELSNQDKHRGMITARANPSKFRVGVNTGGATGSRNGIDNGMRIEMLNIDGRLENGAPFVRIETSVPVTLARLREPIGLDYVVSANGADYSLGDVQRGLIDLQRLMIFVCEGFLPQEAVLA